MAIERFGAAGYRHTSVAEIARALDVSAPAVHAHFSTKAELFDGALAADLAPLVDLLLDLLARQPGAQGWIDAFPSILDEVERRPLLKRVLANQEPEAFRRLAEEPVLTGVRERLTRRLAEGQRGGDVRADLAPDVLAAGLETVVFSMLLAGVQTGLGGADRTRAEGVAAILARGMRSASGLSAVAGG